MIWFRHKDLTHLPWLRHGLIQVDMNASTFKKYRVMIGDQVFEEYTEEFIAIYNRERTWQRLKI